MAFNPSEFIINYSKHGPLRTNKFDCTIYFNQNFIRHLFLNGYSDLVSNLGNLTYSIRTLNIGKKSSEIVEKKYGSTTKIKVPLSKNDDSTISITFLNSQTLIERMVMEKYWDYIFKKDNSTLEFYDNYKSKMTINVYSNDGQSIKKYHYYDCWLQDLGEIRLSQDDDAGVSTFDTSFVYSYYEIEN